MKVKSRKKILKYFACLTLLCACFGLFVSVTREVLDRQERLIKIPWHSFYMYSKRTSVQNYILETKGYEDDVKKVPQVKPEILFQTTPDTTANDKTETTHIGFLKVHKAASTTAQGIFLRFGWKRNLTFVLPPEYSRFNYPNIISMYDPPNENNTLPPPGNKTFDIICHHVIYNKKEWDKYLPLGYALVGTIREPWALFKSMLNYINPSYINEITTNDKIRTFLLNPFLFEPKDVMRSLTNNRMSVEFGVHPDIIKQRDIKAFHKYLEQLDRDFRVVIVAERFDESLVLLRRYLNWSLQDILYVSQNVRRRIKYIKYRPSIEHLELFKNFAFFDYLLFEFFKNKLDSQISAEGPSFGKEVERFQRIRFAVEFFCRANPVVTQSISIAPSEWNQIFRIERRDCELLLKKEINFTQTIRQRQYGSATWKFKMK